MRLAHRKRRSQSAAVPGRIPPDAESGGADDCRGQRALTRRSGRPVYDQFPAALASGNSGHPEDPPAGDVDFSDGGQGFQASGQDLARPGFEVEYIGFTHAGLFSTIRAFECRDPHFLALAASYAGGGAVWFDGLATGLEGRCWSQMPARCLTT